MKMRRRKRKMKSPDRQTLDYQLVYWKGSFIVLCSFVALLYNQSIVAQASHPPADQSAPVSLSSDNHARPDSVPDQINKTVSHFDDDDSYQDYIVKYSIKQADKPASVSANLVPHPKQQLDLIDNERAKYQEQAIGQFDTSPGHSHHQLSNGSASMTTKTTMISPTNTSAHIDNKVNQRSQRFESNERHTSDSTTTDDGRHEHSVDLLAIEATLNDMNSDSDRLQKHHPRHAAPPYATTSQQLGSNKTNFTLNEQNDTQVQSQSWQPTPLSDKPGGETQLLKLLRAPTVPIYLRHPLPETLRPQLIAFQHPAAIRKAAAAATETNVTNGHGDQNGYTINYPPHLSRQSGSFALLPSWPNIYIAQREQQPERLQQQQDVQEKSGQDPKLPTTYPNWSLARNHSDRQTISEYSVPARVKTRPEQDLGEQDIEPRQMEHDGNHRHLHFLNRWWSTNGQQLTNKFNDSSSSTTRQPARRKNLIASEVEYEEEFIVPAIKNSTSGIAQKSDESKDGAASENSWAHLLRQAARNNVTESIMLTNRSIVDLLCDTDSMLIRLKFKQPFHGLVATNLDPARRCRLFGNGSQFYRMRIDLNDCGTRQVMSSLFINNLRIQFRNPFLVASTDDEHSSSRPGRILAPRFHQDLETTPDTDESKTIICSYPAHHSRVPGSQPSGQPSFKKPAVLLQDQNNDIDQQQLEERGLNRSSINLSDRIVESPGGGGGGRDQLAPARLAYYEPILLISGLILLAVAFTLALISSAYLVRRRNQRLTTTTNSTGPKSTPRHPKTSGDLSLSPIHTRSPTDLASRKRPLVAPPLIGMPKEKLSRARNSPIGKKYANNIDSRQRLSLRNKQLSDLGYRNGRTIVDRPTTTVDGSSNSGGASNETTSDSLDSGNNRGEQSSVTTIEIPYARGRQSSQAYRRDNGIQFVSLANSTARADHDRLVRPGRHLQRKGAPVGEKTSVNETVQTDPPGQLGSADKSTTTDTSAQSQYSQYKREVRSHETITERTSYQADRAQSKQAPGKAGSVWNKTVEPKVEHKRQSPLPFGSFRSRLTSPSEFKRLQDVLRLFDGSSARVEPFVDEAGRESWDYSRLRSRISRAVSEPERRLLLAMLNDDEVFRSNVVDSVDEETFSRKLRDNPIYSSKFSDSTWKLLEEILLSVNISKILASSAATKVHDNEESARARGALRDDKTKATFGVGKRQTGDGTVAYRESLAKNNNKTEKNYPLSDRNKTEAGAGDKNKNENKIASSKSKLMSQVDNVRTVTARQNSASDSDNYNDDNGARANLSDDSIGAFRVSQSNSASTNRDADSTLINIDSVTSISAPRNFSTYTSSSFKQVTKYEEDQLAEDSSVPYIDEPRP